MYYAYCLLLHSFHKTTSRTGSIMKRITSWPRIQACLLCFAFIACLFIVPQGDQCEKVGQTGYNKVAGKHKHKTFPVLRLCESIRQCHVFWYLGSFSNGLVILLGGREDTSVCLNQDASKPIKHSFPLFSLSSLFYSVIHLNIWVSVLCPVALEAWERESHQHDRYGH